MYRLVDHQADIAMEVEANDRPGLFREAVKGLCELLTGEGIAGVERDNFGGEFVISAEGVDDEMRLVRLLNELAYAIQQEGRKPAAVRDLWFDDAKGAVFAILAEPSGLPLDQLKREIKAVTYHDVRISAGDKWRVKVVIDV